MVKISSSEITPEHYYLNRRKFMVGAGTLAVGAALAACAPSTPGSSSSSATDSVASDIVKETIPLSDLPAALANTEPYASVGMDELGDELNSFEQITTYNNFYEFSLGKEQVAPASQNFTTLPWTVEVSGLVNNPKVYDFNDILNKFTQEERIYRLRCVEAWSMVVPWVGFSLADLLKEADPKSEAKFVRFETVVRPEEMPGQQRSTLGWPYVEGLRMDEAMNPLATLSTGIYGKQLLPANGAPIRLVVPWKYGFKSIKSIVKIELVDTMPLNTWAATAANEYGFYANVNPEVDHPRWSQASERRIGQLLGRKETLMFNGYGEEVAHLYSGMDLQANF